MSCGPRAQSRRLLGAASSSSNQRQLVERANLYGSAFERSPTAMSVTDLDGRFMHVNAAYAQLLGYDDPAELEVSMRAFASVVRSASSGWVTAAKWTPVTVPRSDRLDDRCELRSTFLGDPAIRDVVRLCEQRDRAALVVVHERR